MRLILKFYTKDYEFYFLYIMETISHCEVFVNHYKMLHRVILTMSPGREGKMFIKRSYRFNLRTTPNVA
jgi:hypothetical protein